MAGRYVMLPDNVMKMTRMLNFLFNDPKGFQDQLEHEIKGKVMIAGRNGKKVGIRWHDSGDFFSQEYFKMATAIAKNFPDVPFYAYTKVAAAAMGEKPKNFIANWSVEANPTERKKLVQIANAQGKSMEKMKKSIIVPESVFKPFVHRVKIELPDGEKATLGQSNSKIEFIPGGEEKFKTALINWWWNDSPDNKEPKFAIDPKTLISYQEYTSMKTHGSEPKWNVYVVPGRDGDVQASRPDVAGSWLLVH
jgi:hypothetical protein